MKFDVLTTADCLSSQQNQRVAAKCPAPVDEAPVLVLKPESATIEVTKTIQYRTFLVGSGKEIEITKNLIYRTSDQDLAIIGAIGGNATGLKVGIVTIGVEWKALQAYAQLTIIADCSQQIIDTVLLFDVSASSAQLFNGQYGSKLSYAKQLGRNWVNSVDLGKDQVAVVTFDQVGVVELQLSQNKDELLDAINNVSSTNLQTNIRSGLEAALTEIKRGRKFGDRPTIILFSDGLNKIDNPLAVASEFKVSGGTIIGIGLRCGPEGFTLMEKISTAGLFLNAYDRTAQDTIHYLDAFRGYLCACAPKGDDSVPIPQLNYDRFQNWNVVQGFVDLCGTGAPGYSLFDLLPGNGLWVDLVGSAAPWLGAIESKEAFHLLSGQNYTLSFKLSGNQRDARTGFRVGVTIGTLKYQEYVLDNWLQDFTVYTIVVLGDGGNHRIKFEQLSVAPGTLSYGNLLDNVRLATYPNDVTVLFDSFDEENAQYQPPACGQGDPNKTQLHGVKGGYYYGYYDCYNPECLIEPPPAQRQDPNQLPDVEKDPVPKIYTATKSYTACCPVPDTTICVTKNSTATSEISLQDAMAKALADAKAQAEAALQCPKVLSGLINLFFAKAIPWSEPDPNPNKVGYAAVGESEQDVWNGLVENENFTQPIQLVDSNGVWTKISIAGGYPTYELNVLDHPDVMYKRSVRMKSPVTLMIGGAVSSSDPAFPAAPIPVGTYDLFIYGHGPEDLDQGRYSVATGVATSPVTLDPSIITNYGILETINNSNYKQVTWHEGYQFVVFRNIVIDPNDNKAIRLIASGVPGRDAFMSGFQLVKRS